MNKFRIIGVGLSLTIVLLVGILASPSVVLAVGEYLDAPFCIPTTGTVTQLYGHTPYSDFHNGVDIAKGEDKGPAVYAPYPGEIIYIGQGYSWEKNYPDIYPKYHAVVINHGKVNGKYAGSFLVHLGKNGDPAKKTKPESYINPSILDGTLKTVLMGTLIGYQGTAGRVSSKTKTHLHFSVREKTSSTPFTAQNFWTTGDWTNPKSYIVGSSSLSQGDYLETNCFPLVRKKGTKTVYFVEKGKKRAFPDRDTFLALGFEWGDVQDLSAKAFDAIPTGASIPSINDRWVVSHFSGKELGMPPVVIRDRPQGGFDHNWGKGSPDSSVPKDYFSSRYVTRVQFPASGNYIFNFTSDDGMRFFIDGVKKEDRWRVQASSWKKTIYVLEGWRILKLEHFENAVSARIAIRWEAADKIGPQVSASFGAEPQRGGWFTSAVPVTITASDPSGIAEIAYQVGPPRDPNGWTRVYNKTSTSFIISREGIHELYFNAKDKSGNWGNPEGFEVIPIDFTPPATAFSYEGPYYEDEEGKLFVSPETQFFLEADDNLSGVAKTNYQINEGEEQIYESEFSLRKESGDGKHEIKYQSGDVAGNEELQNTQEVYLDSIPPTSTDNSDDEWHNEDVIVVTITANDGEGSSVQAIYYWINDGQEEVAEGDQVLVVFGDEGTHELSYYAVDNVENIGGEIHLTLVRIDKTPPTIEGFRNHKPNKYGWYNEDVIVHFVAEDQPDLSGLKSVTPDVVVSTEGKDQEVIGSAEDNAGNTASTVVDGINIDKTPPSSEITFPEEGEYYNAESWEDEIRGIASDNLSGVAAVEVEVVGRETTDAQLEDYGAAETGWEHPLDFAEDGSDDGHYTIRSQATDLAENQESTNEVAFVFDNTPPTSQIAPVKDAYINAEELEGGVILDYTAEDNIALQNTRLYKRHESEKEWDYHYWKPASGTEAGGEFTVKTLHLPEDGADAPSREGLWEFSSSAKDKAQNCENQKNCQGLLDVGEADTWIIYDITPPTSVVTSLEEGAYYNLKIWPGIVGAASDANPKGSEITTSGVAQVEVQVLRDDVTVVDWTTADGIEGWTFEGFPFEDGIYLIYSRATDRAGNQEETFEISFTYDNTAPVSTITSVEEGAYYNTTTWPGIFGEAKDNLSGIAQVEVRVDKDGEVGNWEPVWGADNWKLVGLIPSDGFYTVYSRATDQAGSTESTFTISFIYDNTPPSAPVASIPGGTFTEGEVLKIGLTGEGGAAIYYSLDGSEFALYSGPIAITDDTTLVAYAVDKAGNRSASVTFNYTFNPAPQVLGIQTQETPGVSQEEGEVKGAAAHIVVGETGPEGSGVGRILLVVLIGGAFYLLLRWKILSQK